MKRESILTTTYVSIEFNLFSSATKTHDYPCWDCRLIQIWKNELDAILFNQPSGWLVCVICPEDRCLASGRNNTTLFFKSCHSFSAGSWEKGICYTTKLCILKISSMKIRKSKQYLFQCWNTSCRWRDYTEYYVSTSRLLQLSKLPEHTSQAS